MKKLGLLLAAVCLPALAHATVTSTASTASFTCTNATGPFPFTFPALDAGSLLVIEITTGSPPGVMTILTSSQWTSAPVNNSYANGGSVTLVSACPTGDTLVIARATEPTQLTHYTPNMPALYTNFENNLDQLTTGRQDSYRARQVYIGSVSGSGSASVTYTPLGQFINILFPTPATPGSSTVGWVSALNFGADPTCSLDSTSAIQAAVTFAGTQTVVGGPSPAVYIPRGCYKTSSAIQVPVGV